MCSCSNLSGAVVEERVCSLNPLMKNKDFPLRGKCLLLAGKDIKALYCHYKYHNPLLLLLTSAAALHHLQKWLCLRQTSQCVSVSEEWTSVSSGKRKLILKRSAHVVNVIPGGPFDIFVKQRHEAVISNIIRRQHVKQGSE